MKTIVTTLLLITAYISTYTQSHFSYGNADNQYYPWVIQKNLFDSSSRQIILDLSIKTETLSRIDSKGRQIQLTNKYSTDGKIQQYGHNFGVKKRHTTVYQLKYGKNGLTTLNTSNHKGKLGPEKTYIRNEDGLILNYTSKAGDNKPFLFLIENKFDGKHLTERKVYKNGNENKTAQRWDYQFDTDGNRKKTLYYQKEKLKHTWNYDCKAEGLEEKTKDTSTVCIWKEVDENGNPVSWTQTTDEKGKIVKAKRVEDKETGKFISYETWDMKGRRKVSSYAQKDGSVYTLYRKGKVHYQAITKLNQTTNKIEVSELIFPNHPKWNTKTEYLYDKNNLVVKEIKYKGGKLDQATTTLREFY